MLYRIYKEIHLISTLNNLVRIGKDAVNHEYFLIDEKLRTYYTKYGNLFPDNLVVEDFKIYNKKVIRKISC